MALHLWRAYARLRSHAPQPGTRRAAVRRAFLGERAQQDPAPAAAILAMTLPDALRLWTDPAVLTALFAPALRVACDEEGRYLWHRHGEPVPTDLRIVSDGLAFVLPWGTALVQVRLRPLPGAHAVAVSVESALHTYGLALRPEVRELVPNALRRAQELSRSR
jgi:hypothetical protein